MTNMAWRQGKRQKKNASKLCTKVKTRDQNFEWLLVHVPKIDIVASQADALSRVKIFESSILQY